MKTLVRRTPLTENPPFVLADLKGHHGMEGEDFDKELSTAGHAAALEIEHFGQLALLDQTIRVTILDPQLGRGVSLPVGPMREGSPISITVDGEAFTEFAVVDGFRPYLHLRQGIPQADRVVIEYRAGFGPEETDITEDLRTALWDQAKMHFDAKSPTDAKALTSSAHMARIAARYRGVSL